MLQNLRKRMEAQTKKIQEMINKELEDIKNRGEMSNKITEMKNTLEGNNNRINEAEKWTRQNSGNHCHGTE